jgi:hypothetical protein
MQSGVTHLGLRQGWRPCAVHLGGPRLEACGGLALEVAHLLCQRFEGAGLGRGSRLLVSPGYQQ